MLAFQNVVCLAQMPALVVQTGHSGAVKSVALSADAKILASAETDNAIKLWEMATGRELRTFTGHRESVDSIALSTDGKS